MMMGKKIVIKIGGSLLFTEDNKLHLKKITEFCNIIKNSKNYERIVIVCGGGIIARDYINAVRSLGGNESLCDIFGIELSRINAKLIISKFQDLAYPIVPKSIEELSSALLFGKIVVMGGLQPGQSTTSVALEVAEYINTEEILILTNVKGIYDKDPRKFSDANFYEKLTYKELQNLILKLSEDKQAAAGEYRIFDAVSLQILKRSKIKVLVMSGENLDNFRNYLNEEKNIVGTLISDK